MLFASDSKNEIVFSGHIDDVLVDDDSEIYTKDICFVYVDGDELAWAEIILNTNIQSRSKFRSYTFCGDQAKTILANWNRK